MDVDRPADTWSDGDAYEAYVGRWSREIGREFLQWLDVPPGRRWLDVGSGTGALSASILSEAAPAAVVGVDASPAYVAAARARLDDPRVEFEQGDAVALPFAAQFDAAVSGLMLNFVSDARAAVDGMRRATTGGGPVAAYVWDYGDGIELMRHFWDAAIAVDPSMAELDEAARFPLCRPDALAALWRDVGLDDVATTSVEVTTAFADFDDYWRPFLGGQGAAPAYLVSLPQPAQAAVRDRVRASLPIAADGSITLRARAFAVKGRAPR
jgi:SAM-dependent methyltransferase